MSGDETEGLCCVESWGSDERSRWKCQIPQGWEEKGNPSIFPFYQSLMANSVFCSAFCYLWFILSFFLLYLLYWACFNSCSWTAFYKVTIESISKLQSSLRYKNPSIQIVIYSLYKCSLQSQDFLISVRASLLLSSTKHRHKLLSCPFFALCSCSLTHPPNQSFQVLYWEHLSCLHPSISSFLFSHGLCLVWVTFKLILFLEVD